LTLLQGDGLIYGICEAIDAEKDPECLMLAFRIVQSWAQLYPESSGLLATYAKDVFDILEPYFPIHFTHVSLFFRVISLLDIICLFIILITNFLYIT